MTCLDIGPAMIARAALKCQDYPNVHFHLSSFEDWPVQPHMYDLVISATAFHWIPPEIGYPKAAQLLKPSGALAIFSNEHPTPYTDFFADVQEVYGRVVPEWKSPQLNAPIEARIAQIAARIDATGLFAPVIVKTYAWSRTYTAQESVRLLNTYSDHRNLEAATRAELHHGITAMIDTRYNGAISKPYLTVLYLAKQH
jgi:trans-aconitate methyltransferase